MLTSPSYQTEIKLCTLQRELFSQLQIHCQDSVKTVFNKKGLSCQPTHSGALLGELELTCSDMKFLQLGALATHVAIVASPENEVDEVTSTASQP